MNIKYLLGNTSAVILGLIGLGLLSVSCIAMVYSGNVFFSASDDGSGLKDVYPYAIVMLEVAAWVLWGASAAIWINKNRLLAVLAFVGAFGWESFSGVVHYNYIFNTLYQSVKDLQVDRTTGNDYRKNQIESLNAELKGLDAPIPVPDMGIESIKESIKSTQASAGKSIAQGSTTNGMLILEKSMSSLQYRLADAQEKQADIVSAENIRRDSRKADIRNQLASLHSQIEEVEKSRGLGDRLTEESAHAIALAFAIALKALAMLCSIIPGYLWSTKPVVRKDPDATERFSDTSETLPPAKASNPGKPEVATPIAACTAAPRSDKRMSDLAVQHEVTRESPAADVTGLQELPTADASGLDNQVTANTTAEAAVELPAGYAPIFRELVEMMREHPAETPFPRKGIESLIRARPGFANARLSVTYVGKMYEKAHQIGLLERRGDSRHFTTALARDFSA